MPMRRHGDTSHLTQAVKVANPALAPNLYNAPYYTYWGHKNEGKKEGEKAAICLPKHGSFSYMILSVEDACNHNLRKQGGRTFH